MAPTRHKWDILKDVCIKCGVKRKKQALSKNLISFYGTYMYKYFVNNEWVEKRPECK